MDFKVLRINNQCIPYNAMFGVHRNGLCYNENHVIKGQFYKGIIGELPFHGNFLIIPL